MRTFPPGQPAFPHATALLSVPANHLRHHSTISDGFVRLMARNPLQWPLGTYGFVADGGKLWITDAGLDFEPHALNTSSLRVAVARQEIAVVRRRKVRLRVGFDVEQTDGTVVPFVCHKNDEVFAVLAQVGIPTA